MRGPSAGVEHCGTDRSGWNRSPKNGEVHDHDARPRSTTASTSKLCSASVTRWPKPPRSPSSNWRTTVSWVNGTHSRSTVDTFYGFGEQQHHKTTFTYDIDHPLAFAAQDNGITPVEYVFVALGGCLTAGIASIAQQRKIQLRSVQATVEADDDLHGILGADPEIRNGFTGVRVSYQIDADATPEQIKALVAQSQKRSAVYDILTNPTPVTRRRVLSTRHGSRRLTMLKTSAIVVGAGHCGLAMSRCLADRSIDHVVLERGEVAHSWRTQRWDSLRLLTPNWMTRLPGFSYRGDDPDGYLASARRRGVDRGLCEGVGGARAGQHHRDIGAAGRGRIRGADRPGLVAHAVGRARPGRQHRSQSACAAGRCAHRHHHTHPAGLPQPEPASRRRGARRRRLGKRHPNRRGVAPLRSAGVARRRRARPDAAHLSRQGHSVVDGRGGAAG